MKLNEDLGDMWIIGVVIKMLGFVIWDTGHAFYIWVPVLVIGIATTFAGLYRWHQATARPASAGRKHVWAPA